MALQNYTDQEIVVLQTEFLDTLRGLGGYAGNTALLRRLRWSDALYWSIHEHLVDLGRLRRRRGRGGSVELVPTPHLPAHPSRRAPSGSSPEAAGHRNHN